MKPKHYFHVTSASGDVVVKNRAMYFFSDFMWFTFCNLHCRISFLILCFSWSFTLLCQCGDIHLNKLSILHYNVQSISKQIDVIQAEFGNFDILAFSDTWLSPNTSNNNIKFDNFHPLESKDRPNDNHGLVYLNSLAVSGPLG